MRISDWSSDVCSSDLVEILSIEQDRHGKPLRHKFEIPVDLLASPDQSWFRYEPDQILEAFRWLAISGAGRSEEHTSELQSLMRISYAVFCLKKKKPNKYTNALNTPQYN